MGRSIPLNVALAVGLAACAAHGPAPSASPARPAAPGKPAPPLAPPPPAEPFRERVRPVLAQRCAPCHEPGGRMYVRLPFDRPQIVRDKREGVLRRLKGDERAIVEAWLDGN